MARIPATPIDVWAVNQTDPTCSSRMTPSSAGPSRSSSRPSRNSCPIRWLPVILSRTRRAQEVGAAALGEGGDEAAAGVEVGGGEALAGGAADDPASGAEGPAHAP